MIKTMRTIFLFCILLFVLLPLASSQEWRKVCIKDVCVEAQAPDTVEGILKGLMFREYLGEEEGMLFIFPIEYKHEFWMKNMNFPLDIIWIDKDKKIVDIKAGVMPCAEACDNLIPIKEALYVLEVNAGFVKKNNIGLGDEVQFKGAEDGAMDASEYKL